MMPTWCLAMVMWFKPGKSSAASTAAGVSGGLPGDVVKTSGVEASLQPSALRARTLI